MIVAADEFHFGVVCDTDHGEAGIGHGAVEAGQGNEMMKICPTLQPGPNLKQPTGLFPNGLSSCSLAPLPPLKKTHVDLS